MARARREVAFVSACFCLQIFVDLIFLCHLVCRFRLRRPPFLRGGANKQFAVWRAFPPLHAELLATAHCSRLSLRCIYQHGHIRRS